MASRPTILRRQNEPSMHRLLRAMSASHARARRLDSISTALSLAIAGAGIVGTFVMPIANAVTAVGGLWALAYAMGLSRFTDAELKRAATIQEMFDVQLYGLPWNSILAGDPLRASEISGLSARYRGRDDMIENYYEIADSLRPPFDVLACQMMNLGWGARVRRRFARLILVFVGGWTVAGVVIGAVAHVTVAQLVLTWYIPSLAALMLGLDIHRRQSLVVNERQRVLQQLRSSLESLARKTHLVSDDEIQALARHVQDVIFLTRVSCPRVPDWFFFSRRPSDRVDFAADMHELQSLLARD